MVTVILNGYKRGKNLNVQMEALKAQTVQPTEILLWYNNPGDDDLKKYQLLSLLSSFHVLDCLILVLIKLLVISFLRNIKKYISQ